MRNGLITTNSGQTAWAPGIKKRAGNQNARIKDGLQDGSIGKLEAKVLRAQRNSIKNQLDAAKSDDGVLGPRERRQIHHRANNASKTIYAFKHN
jgi:hypothetical protein